MDIKYALKKNKNNKYKNKNLSVISKREQT